MGVNNSKEKTKEIIREKISENKLPGEIVNLASCYIDALTEAVFDIFPLSKIAIAILKICKTGIEANNAYDNYFLLESYREPEGIISDFEREALKNKLSNNDTRNSIINTLNSFCIEGYKDNKTDLLQKLFTSFIDKKITETYLIEYVTILDKISIDDIRFLSTHRLPSTESNSNIVHTYVRGERNAVSRYLIKLESLGLISLSYYYSDSRYILSNISNTDLADRFLTAIGDKPYAYNHPSKGKKTLKGLIKHLEEKGVSFEKTSTKKAENYLKSTNQYFRVAAYRENYKSNDKDNHNNGKYENLDFRYLQELSLIDDALRNQILKMTLDIERYLKSLLLEHIQLTDEDGYSIVTEYFERYPGVRVKLSRLYSSNYSQNLVTKYVYAQCPVWVLVELLTFRQLLDLIRIYLQKYEITCEPFSSSEEHPWLRSTRNLRNAAAHGNCLIYDLRPRSNFRRDNAKYSDTILVLKTLGVIEDNPTDKKIKKLLYRLSNNFIFDFINLIILYKRLMPINDWKKCLTEWKRINNKIIQKHYKDWFDADKNQNQGNMVITRAYDLITSVFEGFDNGKDKDIPKEEKTLDFSYVF